MNELSRQISTRFAGQEPVVIAVIIAGQGVSPRKPGTKMLFFIDNTTWGSIGGGAFEAAVQKRVGTIWDLWESGGAVLEWFGSPGDTAAGSDLPCGGRQQVLIRKLVPDAAHRRMIRNLVEAPDLPDPLYLVSRLEGRGPAFSDAVLCWAGNCRKRLAGDDEPAIEALIEQCGKREVYLSEPIDGRAFLVERCAGATRLYLFGSGHVCAALAKLASFVGFEIVVVDVTDRFANRDGFPDAARIVIQKDFDRILDGLSLDHRTYAVIATRGHGEDRRVLKQVLATEAGYVGMLGSRAKIARCFKLLAEQGVPEKQLARVHAPIGLDIGSETPEEIAVSIAAQLIQARRA